MRNKVKGSCITIAINLNYNGPREYANLNYFPGTHDVTNKPKYYTITININYTNIK